VNSPFQRFKRNLLLWLQLLLLVLLVLAAMQPFLSGGAGEADRLPVLIDTSASMAALDEKERRSRLEVALHRVRARIASLRSDQEICLVTFSNRARRRTGFTADRGLLLDTLDGIRVEDVESDPVDGLRMAAALARTEPFDQVLLLTDGNLPRTVDFELPFRVDYQRLPPAGPNLGITVLNARRAGESSWRVLVKVEGSVGHGGNALVELSIAGDVIASSTVSVLVGEPREAVFDVTGERGANLDVRLVPDGFDSLATDNTATLALADPRRLRVWIDADFGRFVETVTAMPDIDLETGDGATGAFDLVIADGAPAASRSGRVALCTDSIPRAVESLIKTGPGECQVVDWDRSSPLLRYVDFEDVAILERVSFAPGATEADLENRGYRVLVHGHLGPLLLEHRDREAVVFHLLFDPDRSTLPFRLGPPILLVNLVNLARYEAGLVEVRAVRTGVLPPLDVRPDTWYTIEEPGGPTRRERSDAGGLLSGVPAARVGSYVVTGEDDFQKRFGVALLSARETRLDSIDRIRFREDLAVTAAEPVDAERPLWPTLAVLALVVLLVEWWVYQRRPRGIG